LWNTSTGKKHHELDSVIHGIAVAPDHTLAVATDDSRVTVVRERGNAVLAGHLGRVFAVAFTSDSKTLVSGGEDRELIVWDATTGERRGALEISAPVRSLAFGSDDDTLIALAGDRVELWSLARAHRILVLPMTTSRLDAFAVNPRDGSIAAVGGNGVLLQWTAAGVKLNEITNPARPYTAVAFAPDGQFLVAAGPGLADIWHVEPGGLTRQFALDGATGIVHAAAVSGDSSMIITAGDNGRAHVWDAAKGKLLGSRDYHEKPITAITVDADTLWIASEDGTLGAWDVSVETGTAAEIAARMREKHVPEHLDADNVVRGGGTR
jgi:WD40 repeat protein